MKLPKDTVKYSAAIVAAILFFIVAVNWAASHRGPTPAEVKQGQVELRNVLVWGCQHEKNPERAVFRAMIREEIQGSKKVKPSYFPGIPKAVLHRLIHQQVEAKRRRLRKFRPINCGAFYPAP